MSSKDNILKFDVVSSKLNLDYYEDLLKKFQQWQSIRREIKLTNLLEGKRVQFDVDEISNTGSLWGMILSTPKEYPSLEDACFNIKSMSFIINGDVVEKLTLGIVPLKTDKGKILEDLVESNIEIEIREFLVNKSILYFYINLPKMAA